jgi:16S rRNA (uracil1498-N3)-methyltransferase
MSKPSRKNKRLSRFFIDQELSPDSSIELPPTLVNYIVNVLRMSANDEIVLFNGLRRDGLLGEYSASLSQVSKRKVTADIQHFKPKDVESPLKTHLLQGLSRNERMDYTIQKAVELGINQITPVLTHRSNSKLKSAQLEKKRQHWQSIANSACEQSGRTARVTVNAPVEVAAITQFEADLKLLLAPTASQTLTQLGNQQPGQVNIFIGPEGGLSDEEIDWACRNNYSAIRLGGRILRTETAGLTVLSILQHLWGDLSL